MGREIRMVPPHWDHPHKEDNPNALQPMYDKHFADAAQEWKDGFAAWERGERSSYFTEIQDLPGGYQYWEYEGSPPDREYYRPWKDEEATWFQLWETVSEGTPVSPPFATREELAQYLAENGDFWDQSRSKEGRFGFTRGESPAWGAERANAFVESGWAPSGMSVGGQFLEGKDVPLFFKQEKEKTDTP